MLEKQFWQKIKKGFGSYCIAERLEAKNDSGWPDVFFTLFTSEDKAYNSMVELKVTFLRRKGRDEIISIPKYTEDQRAFARRHDTFLLVYCKPNILLYRGAVAAEVGKGQHLEWHLRHSLNKYRHEDNEEVWDSILEAMEKELFNESV